MEKRRRQKIINGWVFWLCTLPIGIVIGLLFCGLRLSGRLRVIHPERFPAWEGKVIVASNHPSLWEPILLIALFFLQYLFRPRQFAPWSTPDQKNYYNKWYWWPVKPRFVPVPRGNGKGEARSLVEMIKILRKQMVLILFPEAGRTYKGKSFLCSPGGRKLRPLKSGIGKVVCKTRATVVPVWVEGTERVLPNNGSFLPRLWHRVTIVIGEPIRYADRCLERKDITQQISNALLATADDR